MALIAAVWIGIAVSVALIIYLGPRVERWFQTPKELRSDWWPAFEHEFRAYATRSGAKRGRGRGSGRPPLDQ